MRQASLGWGLVCLVALSYCHLVAADIQNAAQSSRPANHTTTATGRRGGPGGADDSRPKDAGVTVAIIGLGIAGIAYATSYSCSIFSWFYSSYCNDKCLDLNRSYLPYLPKGPNLGGQCSGGKCQCTVYKGVSACTVSKGGLNYPGQCASDISYCPLYSRKDTQNTIWGGTVTGCPSTARWCCY